MTTPVTAAIRATVARLLAEAPAGWGVYALLGLTIPTRPGEVRWLVIAYPGLGRVAEYHLN
jgi:hypothetical protein